MLVDARIVTGRKSETCSGLSETQVLRKDLSWYGNYRLIHFKLRNSINVDPLKYQMMNLLTRLFYVKHEQGSLIPELPLVDGTLLRI